MNRTVERNCSSGSYDAHDVYSARVARDTCAGHEDDTSWREEMLFVVRKQKPSADNVWRHRYIIICTDAMV